MSKVERDWRRMTPWEKQFITSVSRGFRVPRRLIVTNVPLHLRICDAMRFRP